MQLAAAVLISARRKLARCCAAPGAGSATGGLTHHCYCCEPHGAQQYDTAGHPSQLVNKRGAAKLLGLHQPTPEHNPTKKTSLLTLSAKHTLPQQGVTYPSRAHRILGIFKPWAPPGTGSRPLLFIAGRIREAQVQGRPAAHPGQHRRQQHQGAGVARGAFGQIQLWSQASVAAVVSGSSKLADAALLGEEA